MNLDEIIESLRAKLDGPKTAKICLISVESSILATSEALHDGFQWLDLVVIWRIIPNLMEAG